MKTKQHLFLIVIILTSIIPANAQDSIQKYFHENGKLSLATPYKGGKANGIQKRYYESGKILFEAPFTDGKKNGIEKRYYESGKIYWERNFTNGKENGIMKDYFENGRLEYETPYTDGKVNGNKKKYYESGQLKSENLYSDDELNGITKNYYISGKLAVERQYTNGLSNGFLKEYYESGKLKLETTYANDKENGIQKRYYENGILSQEAIYYTNGELNGIEKRYYENGALMLETQYAEGKRNGIEKGYYQNGQLSEILTYKDDVEIGKREKYINSVTGNYDDEYDVHIGIPVSLAEIANIKIGTQTWATKNLDVNKFRNGDPIYKAESAAEWEKAGKDRIPAWCYYYGDYGNGLKYGRLYNWYAVNDPRGLAPIGWHVPSNLEWTTLTNYLGEYAEIKMKSMQMVSGWPINLMGSNSSGFTALPGGKVDDGGEFDGINTSGYWWSSTEGNSLYALIYKLDNNYTFNHIHKGYGLSVRCIKD